MPTSLRVVLAAALAFSASASIANAQALIKVNDDVNFRIGVLGQFQADWLHDDATDTTATNLFVRRARLILGGQVAKGITFFMETDVPNLGKTLANGKNITPSMIIQDAYAEFKQSDVFALDAGLMYIPFSRNSLQAGGTLLALDYGAYTFTQSAAEQSSTGRDTGFQARGHVLDNRLEYRVGAFQGMRTGTSDNALRVAGRVQYDFFDRDSNFFYTGTSLGTKKFLAIGGAFDTQSQYQAYDTDVFVDFPLGPGALTAQFDYNHFDGDITLQSLKKQNDVLFEAGYLIRSIKLTPVLQLTHRDVSDVSTGDETRTSFGVNYWWVGHNANIKAAYVLIKPSGVPSQHEFTVQLQIFYF